MKGRVIGNWLRSPDPVRIAIWPDGDVWVYSNDEHHPHLLGEWGRLSCDGSGVKLGWSLMRWTNF